MRPYPSPRGGPYPSFTITQTECNTEHDHVVKFGVHYSHVVGSALVVARKNGPSSDRKGLYCVLEVRLRKAPDQEAVRSSGRYLGLK